MLTHRENEDLQPRMYIDAYHKALALSRCVCAHHNPSFSKLWFDGF